MSDMTVTETMERFTEGLKKAASRCRELAHAQKNRNWIKIAVNLETMLSRGKQLHDSKPLSQQEANSILNAKMGRDTEKDNG